MGPLDLLNHLANFAAPALWMAVMLSLLARIIMKKVSGTPEFHTQAAINFVVGVTVLGFGLWWFGRDGKMATYAMMALACATSQWVLLRGWKAWGGR
jgi:hypothetical protein